jgi:hypothetical protein
MPPSGRWRTNLPHFKKLSSVLPFPIIRNEAVLSKLPVHNLAKKGTADIYIVMRDPQGGEKLLWIVSHSQRYGQPRQLAYKLDTIVINRKIDEAARPVPKVLRLGSLREIAAELGMGGDTNGIRKALRQNAFVGITAKLTYKAKDGTTQQLEADFTRYSVVFTGEQLPDGTSADAVYIIFHEPYFTVLNQAPVRPLDYEYLKQLPPAAQRFYEIISFRIFAALRNKRPYVRICYSDYCLYSAQKRHFDRENFRVQMYKIHQVHRRSGYISDITIRNIYDAEGKPDWELCYVPGPKAEEEYRVFNCKELITNVAVEEEGTGDSEGTTKSGTVKQAIELVTRFYELFHGQQGVKPNENEWKKAAQLIAEHGLEAANYILNFSYQQSKISEYHPAQFGGILHFTQHALARMTSTRERKQQNEVAIHCLLCNQDGWISFQDNRTGDTFSRECPHDPEVIKEFERKRDVRKI